MPCTDHSCHSRFAVHPYDRSLFVALELSKSVWLTAVNAPGSDKMSKYRVPAGDAEALRSLLARLKTQAERHCGGPVKIVSIYEAGLDGFWIHRMLEANDVESHVVDAASIAVDRRSRRAKTDRIDVEKLLRTLMGWARGERQICSMVRPPSPTEEDARRLTRERGTLVTERVRHVNRIRAGRPVHSCCAYEVSGRNSPRYFRWRHFIAASPTGGRLRRIRGWHRAPGRVAASMLSKAFRKRATPGYERQ